MESFDITLLLPLAVLSVVSLVSFFVERFAITREIKMVAAEEDKLEATLKLLRRDIGEVSLGAGSVFIPIIILTLLGSIPNWVLWGAWLFVFIATIRLPLVHFSRGRGADTSKRVMKSFLPLAPLIMLSFPLMLVLYGYTLYAVVEAL